MGTKNETVRIGVYVPVHLWRCRFSCPQVLERLNSAHLCFVVLVCANLGGQAWKLEVRATQPNHTLQRNRQSFPHVVIEHLRGSVH